MADHPFNDSVIFEVEMVFPFSSFVECTKLFLDRYMMPLYQKKMPYHFILRWREMQ